MKHFELIDGIPVEKSGGALSGRIVVALGTLLGQFIQSHRLGHMFGSTAGYCRCFPSRPDLLRKPDASFVARGRFPDDKAPRGDAELAPDLAVEVISPNDTYEDLEEKVADYRSAGVPLIWVVNPSTRSVLVRRLDRTCTELTDADSLSGEDVIAGFSCRVAEVFV